jgi:hypothetical protein
MKGIKMTYFRKSFFLVFIFFICSYATQETVIQVVQPIYTANGITESVSTYVLYMNWPGDAKVSLTCAENRVKTESEFENRNLANIFGLSAEIFYEPNSSLANLEVLKIKITISEKEQVIERYKQLQIDEVIQATVNCLIKNISSFQKIKSVEIMFDANSKFSKYSKVYPVKN